MGHTYILGISAFYHDAAAAIIKDGEIIAAAEEERFTRKKHDHSFPVRAIEFCLKAAGVTVGDVEIVAFYEKPFLKFGRIIKTHLAYVPGEMRSFISSVPPWINKELFVKERIRKVLGYEGKVIFPEHHHSHAASAFYPSPFDEAAILTIDGAGEWATASIARGKGNKIEILKEMCFPHSLGFLYSVFTGYCGFKMNSGEYKLMGLAPYGEPRYVDIIIRELIDLKKDGSFRINIKYFDFSGGQAIANKKFHGLFGGPPREPESRIEKRYMDVARSIQTVTGKIVTMMADHARDITGMENLCLSGGVALNSVANGKVLREGRFRNVWIQPASSDAGAALGSALIGWHEYLGNERGLSDGTDRQKATLLGPSFSDDEIEACLIAKGISYERIPFDEVPAVVADLLAEEKVIGWFQGRMEFGPRALGSRSILADPRAGDMRSVMNERIKFRESFRPFAPSVLREKAGEYFGMEAEDPYMLLVSSVESSKRGDIPAVTHVDHSARVQTVKREDNPLYYDLLNEFYEKYGCPLVINTSFNVRGEPIVCTPEDALRCFARTNIDYLVMGTFLVSKTGHDVPVTGLEPAYQYLSD